MTTEFGSRIEVDEEERGLSKNHKRIISYLFSRGDQEKCPVYMRGEVIAIDLNFTPIQVERLMAGIVGDVDGIMSGKGYDMDMVLNTLASKFRVS